MENEKSKNEKTFELFIKSWEALGNHFKNQKRKTLQRFGFSYAFETQLETKKPLFVTYFYYNGGYIQDRVRMESDFEFFKSYVRALHDVARSME